MADATEYLQPDNPISREKPGRVQVTPEVMQQMRGLAQQNGLAGIGYYLWVYGLAVAAAAIAWWSMHPLAILAAVYFIAARQHSLYILNHDASHYALFRSKAMNKAVGSLLSNFMMLHHPEAWSFVMWRRIHVFHHSKLFTEGDPNYVGRMMKGDTERTYTLSSLAWACLKAGLMGPFSFFLARQDYVPPNSRDFVKGKMSHVAALLLPFRNDPEMERERLQKIAFFVLLATVVTLAHGWVPFLLFWVLPMYTVYPMILTFMDLTEHRWNEDAESLVANSRSVTWGPFAKLLLGDLPRGLHREHHIFLTVRAALLPELSAILQRADVVPPPTTVPQMLAEFRAPAKA